MNTGDLSLDVFPEREDAEWRVLRMQKKLHRWATDNPDRRFDDLANLVYDPAFLVVAWHKVRGNKGARTAGVDGVTPRGVGWAVTEVLAGIRKDLKAGEFVPSQVRQKDDPQGVGQGPILGDSDCS